MTRSRAGAVGVVALAAFLLLTMGGAVVAAPVTVPALLWVARRGPGRLRVVAAVVAALTAAELAWALVYVVAGESRPAIWSLPLLAAGGIATGALGRPARSSSVRASAGAGRAKR